MLYFCFFFPYQHPNVSACSFGYVRKFTAEHAGAAPLALRPNILPGSPLLRSFRSYTTLLLLLLLPAAHLWTMSSPPPILALVGATGLVGGAILPSLLAAVASGKLSALRLLTTSSPEDPKFAQLQAVPRVQIVKVSYADVAGLQAALEGAQVLVSAMGTKTSAEGSYEENKAKLVEAAAKAGVKVRAVGLMRARGEEADAWGCRSMSRPSLGQTTMWMPRRR